MKYCKNCKHLSISDYIFEDKTRSVSCSLHKKFFCFVNKDVQKKDIKLKDKCKGTHKFTKNENYKNRYTDKDRKIAKAKEQREQDLNFIHFNKNHRNYIIKIPFNGKIVHVGTSTSLAGARKMIKEWRKINDLD